jgi:hypothetical protein
MEVARPDQQKAALRNSRRAPSAWRLMVFAETEKSKFTTIAQLDSRETLLLRVLQGVVGKMRTP